MGAPLSFSSTTRSWANSWANGVAKAAKDLGVKTTMVGNVETPDQYVAQGSSFAAKGYNLIVFAHGAMDAPAQKLARQFPKVQFVQAPFEFAEPLGFNCQLANGVESFLQPVSVV